MRRWISEPLLHFAVAGVALFAAYAFIGHQRAGGGPGVVVRIGPGELNWMKETWSRQWQREPSQAELRGLVTDYLKEELLAREARAMALDENDTIVRRRLAQKLEFLMQDTLRLAEPSADDLQHFFGANPELFLKPARISFRHIYFNRERRRDAVADANAALAALNRPGPGASAERFGDQTLIDDAPRDADEPSITAQFGTGFAKAVFALTPGGWRGPIESAYGVHLVRVDKIAPAEQRSFADVRTQVLERWRYERERERSAAYFASLLKKYDVAVDESIKSLIGPLDGPLNGTPMPPGGGESGMR